MNEDLGPAEVEVDLAAARLRSLLLADHHERAIEDVVHWFGALQGQDLASASWSLGLRSGSTRVQVEAAFASGSIVRTWPMRGTLHVVPARDAAWMVRHLGARALAGAQRRRVTLGIDGPTADRAVHALAEALQDGPLTRSQCRERLQSTGADTSGQRTYHLLWYACQRGLACVGPDRDGEQTFLHLKSLVPDPVELDRSEALACTAERFVRSHGPVSEYDLARWADLSLADARAGIAGAPGLVRRRAAGRPLFLTEQSLDAGRVRVPDALALPGFDELVLGYRDRSAQLSPQDEPRVVPGGNGVFQPTLLVAGRVRGTWRRRMLTSKVVLTGSAFEDLSGTDRAACERALVRFAQYLGREPDVRWAEAG